MKCLLLPLLAALATPTAIRTSEIAPYYLIIGDTKKEGVKKVPMASLEVCKKAKKLF